MENFNPSENGLRDRGVFGLPFNENNSKIILIPVPWEVTTSYNSGTSQGPGAILKSSWQIDLSDNIYNDGWKKGIAMLPVDKQVLNLNNELKKKANKYLYKYCRGIVSEKLQREIDDGCLLLNDKIEKITEKYLNDNKIVGLVGGDHSIILGYVQSLCKKYDNFGILQIDAHADIRPNYEGLKYSHASIFDNVLKIKNINKLVQVGLRDISPIENEIIKDEEIKDRISVFYDQKIRSRIYQGEKWENICDEIIEQLPNNIYISFDIDGLKPYLCPNTGTPVPGGLEIEELVFLFEKIISSGKKIIGFDLCEVAPGINLNEWDGNVGARILYKLSLLALKSQNFK